MILKNVEKKEKNLALFQVETDAAEFEAAVQAAYLKNKGNIYIPGFRKGKAPRAVVEGMYGHEVFYQDAMDELAPKAFEFGLEESKLQTVGAPSISDVNVTEAKTVVYTFAVTLYPEVTLGQYKGLSAPKESGDVSEEEVDEEIEKTRKRNARKVSVEDREAKMGDTVTIDFDGFLDGERFEGGKAEDYSLVLGSHSFVPGFEEQVAGMKIGEEKDLDITFPQDYAENLAGKAVVFKVTLKGITEDELPELDDEFAKDVSEFDTLAEYRADVRAKLEKNKAEQAENAFRSLIMKQAADNMTVEIPQVMLAEKAEEIVRNYAANFGMTDRSVPMDKLLQMMGLTRESMNVTIMPAAEFQVKHDLLIDAVVKAENIEVSEEEVEEYAKKIAESVGASVEEVKQYFGLEYIAQEKKREMATSLILDSAVVGEAPAAAEEPAAEGSAEEPAAEENKAE
ncbi:MAG: trigger factor [Oscillospiraceae bacterium]|nr:trigger factor [Oscillospiraceae bacterium]